MLWHKQASADRYLIITLKLDAPSEQRVTIGQTVIYTPPAPPLRSIRHITRMSFLCRSCLDPVAVRGRPTMLVTHMQDGYIGGSMYTL